MLEGFRERAHRYDAENTFFVEDFDDLKGTGYLAAVVPTDMGGSGLTLDQLVVAQRHLASYAPATALGVNMHLVWVQVARFLHDRGIDALDWVLREAVAGEVFAFGISEAGNEAVLMDAFSDASVSESEAGGYEVSGTKIFTTLSPVWTRLGVHAKCETGGGGLADPLTGNAVPDPHLVFGFVRRDGSDNASLLAGEVSHPGIWNPLGMRATQSYTTELRGVRITEADVAARLQPFDGSNPIVLAIFSSFSILTAAVYAGIADRAIELARQAAAAPAPRPEQPDAVRLDDPDVAAKLTDAVLAHRRSLDALTVLARDVDEDRARDDWFLVLAAARNLVTDEARSAVDVAMRAVGARGFQADSELARLYRDVLAGMFHPSSSRALAATVRASVTD